MRNYKHTLLLGSTLLLIPSAVYAQEAPEEETSNEVTNGGIDEIVVTAQKREQNLQDVPLAITAVTDDTLRANNVTNFVGLSNLTPGLTVSPAEGGDRVTLSIRGVGQEANQNDVAAPSVSFHQDGVYIVSPFALGAAFLDVGTIEVVRGPQGTLFGQNSTGGATNINTVKPQIGEFSGFIQAGYGSFDYRNLVGAINVSLGSTFAVRASGEYIEQDGSTLNIFNGQLLDDKNQTAWRISALWEALPNFTITGTAQQFQSDTNGAARFGLYDPTQGDRLLSQDDPSSLELDTALYSLIVNWDLPAFTVKYLGSRQIAEIIRSRDNDFTSVYSSFIGVDTSTPAFANIAPLALNNILRRSFEQNQDQLHKSWTSELNIVSTKPLLGSIDWVLGGFWFDQEIEALTFERVDQNRNGILDPFNEVFNPVVFGIPPFGADVGFQSDFFPSRTSYSFYGQATWNASSALRLTGGLRWTRDNATNLNFNFFNIQRDLATADITNISKSLTGQARIEYDISDDVLAYASFTKGFKPGGNNLTFALATDIFPDFVTASFESETIYAYETGLKADLLDRRLRLNLAGFYYDYRNLQTQSTDPRNVASGVVNIPESRVIGIEAEFQYVPTENFSLSGNVTLLDSEITESFIALDSVLAAAAELPLRLANVNQFANSVTQARLNVAQDVQGNDLAKTPAFAANLTGTFTTPNLGNFIGKASATVSYRDSLQSRIFNNPLIDRVPAHILVNTQISLTYKENLSFILTAQNLLNSDIIASRFTDSFGVFSTFDQKVAPQTFILAARYNF